jgi:hypothetical protein
VFPDFLLSSDNCGLLGLIIECGVRVGRALPGTGPFRFNPGRHYQRLELEAKDLLKSYVGLSAYEWQVFVGETNSRE